MKNIKNVDSYVYNDNIHLLNINNKGIKVMKVFKFTVGRTLTLNRGFVYVCVCNSESLWFPLEELFMELLNNSGSFFKIQRGMKLKIILKLKVRLEYHEF